MGCGRKVIAFWMRSYRFELLDVALDVCPTPTIRFDADRFDPSASDSSAEAAIDKQADGNTCQSGGDAHRDGLRDGAR